MVMSFPCFSGFQNNMDNPTLALPAVKNNGQRPDGVACTAPYKWGQSLPLIAARNMPRAILPAGTVFLQVGEHVAVDFDRNKIWSAAPFARCPFPSFFAVSNMFRRHPSDRPRCRAGLPWLLASGTFRIGRNSDPPAQPMLAV
ncbi:hypothetical protein [Rhizobium leguminosarum]|uniref:hypothetical protein n=1 Tax=Rhizobium leguminosarum TaxID=384 RepID=UPI003F96F89E